MEDESYVSTPGKYGDELRERATRMACSNGSKLVVAGAREYDGGPAEAIAFATVFLEIPN